MPARNGTYIQKKMKGTKVLFFSPWIYVDPSKAVIDPVMARDFKIVFDESEKADVYKIVGYCDLENDEWVEIAGRKGGE